MKALVVVAHGSRKKSSNDEVCSLVQTMSEQTHPFEFVRACFLEIAEPSIGKTLTDCIEVGATEIVVMPYFLSAGTHVTNDIPREVDSIQQKHPEINISIRTHIGAGGFMPRMLIEAAIDG